MKKLFKKKLSASRDQLNSQRRTPLKRTHLERISIRKSLFIINFLINNYCNLSKIGCRTKKDLKIEIICSQ